MSALVARAVYPTVSFTNTAIGTNSSYLTEAMSPTVNNVYGVVQMEYAGGNKYDLQLFTVYNNSNVEVSGRQVVPASLNEYEAEFAPANVTYCRYGYEYTIPCSGSNTSSSYCLLANEQYKLKVINGNWFGGSVQVVGHLYGEN